MPQYPSDDRVPVLFLAGPSNFNLRVFWLFWRRLSLVSFADVKIIHRMHVVWARIMKNPLSPRQNVAPLSGFPDTLAAPDLFLHLIEDKVVALTRPSFPSRIAAMAVSGTSLGIAQPANICELTTSESFCRRIRLLVRRYRLLRISWFTDEMSGLMFSVQLLYVKVCE